MAPTRKSRSVNKRYSSINEVSPNKDGEDAKQNNSRKRKLSDMLGPKWSKEELTRFYDSYRKHGKDWKKVAASVRNRSIEMVEALYTMNRAYLSLPEGTASVVGLIAMMTDHYCNLAGSDSEQESNDGAGIPRKAQKRPRGKVHPSAPRASEEKTLSPLPNIESTYGCLSLLKKKRSGGSRSRAVGKRTPRFPVSFSFENVNREKYISPSRRGLKMKANANDDEVANEIALALAEASHRGGSPQISQTPNKKTKSVMSSSPVHKTERRYSDLESARSIPGASNMDEEDEGSMEADTGELSRYGPHLMECGLDKLFQRARRSSGKKLEIDDNIENQLDDIKEACSGTEESQRLGVGRGKYDVEVADSQISRSSLQGPRKRSKKVLFTKDEESAFDALQTLADLSLRMPGVSDGDESLLQVKDEYCDHVDESGSQEAIPASHIRERQKSSTVKAKGNPVVSRYEATPTKTSKLGKVSVLDDSAEHDSKMEPNQPAIKSVRKRPKSMAPKNQKTEAHVDINRSESLEAEARVLENKLTSKIKGSSQSASQTLAKNHEHSSSTDPRREGSDSAQSVQVSVVNQAFLPTKARSRRKMNLKKPEMLRDLKLVDKNSGDQTNDTFSSLYSWATGLKEMFSNCLSNYWARRWCIFEWFYSAIDFPWFAKREFVEYLFHVGLGHVPRLTRVEWGVIRSSLGKPRRFSEQFLKEEKEKLNQYRDSVRAHYAELREGTREGLPTDLARPLSVGQRVIAIHPKTREVHDGSVLTVDHSRCRVQFDRPELGVEFVMDVDCMPCNPLENMPTSLARNTVSIDRFFENFNELKLNGLVKDYMKYPSGDANGLSHLSPSTHGLNASKQTKVATADASAQGRVGSMEAAIYKQTTYSQPSTLAQIQAKEADVQALSVLTRALDKKEALILELKHMNDDVLENQKDGNSSLKDSETFKKQYAAILVQLHEANQQVSSALYCLRQRNTYQGHIPLTWPNANFIDSGRLLCSFDFSASQSQEPGSHVNEITESSKTKARTMVDAAMQAMSTLKFNENNVQKIEEVIDYVNDWLPLHDSCSVPTIDIKVENAPENKEPEIPSELISQCVATLLMIQKCTERQSPPSDVAQILDSAVTGLQPCCSQNLPVYAEIQKCMGIIRNQILALIPT